jgi:subtilisin family serine protease
MKRYIIFFALLWSTAALATIKVAVIDTGIDPKYKAQLPLCPSGHKDFTGTGLEDNIGHGTHIAGLIDLYAKGSDYCQIILKAYDKSSKVDSLTSYQEALGEAIALDVDVINVSANGPGSSFKERWTVKKALDKGITVVVAAGNDATNLDVNCNTYPACYDPRIIVVGNKTKTGQRAHSSNYGKIVKIYEVGEDVESINGTLSGTSQSTAIVSGKAIALLAKRRKKK